MTNIWFWKNKKTKTATSLDEEVYKLIKKHQLKTRTKNAIKHVTNWEFRLMDFMEKYEDDQDLIVKIAGYRSYLLRNGANEEEAARECLEMYQHKRE